MDSTTFESSCKIQSVLMSQDSVLLFATIIVMLFMMAIFASAAMFLAALKEQHGLTLMVARTALSCMTLLASEGRSSDAAKTSSAETTSASQGSDVAGNSGVETE